MTGEIVIISPELKGGVGDYTGRLVQHLPRVSALRFVIPKVGTRPASSFEHYPVEEAGGTARDLRDRLPDRSGKVLLQYSAYGFDWLGYPRWLIRGILDWKKHSGGALVIMFHEIWTIWPVWNRNYLLQQLHRRDLRKLLQVADAVFTSTASQAEHLAVLSPRCPIEILPVGSNVRRVQTTEEERVQGLAILFGLQRTRIRALRSMRTELMALGAAGRIRKIVTVGSGASREGDDEELARLQEFELSDGFEQLGALPEEKVSELLSTGEFAISAQDELSITKSGTFMAYAAHGLNIVSCHANASGPEPLSLMISPDDLLKGAGPIELQSRRERLRQWQERTSGWSHIANQIARALEL